MYVICTTLEVPFRKNPDLVIITLRVRKQDVAKARKVAKTEAIPYQHVLRRWISSGAEAARKS